MMNIKKTTVRLSITLPETTAQVQRLYDYGTWFDLSKETITNTQKILTLLESLLQQGGKKIDQYEYISDDDFKEHQTIVYEYIR